MAQASMMACRLVPLPEIRTTSRFFEGSDEDMLYFLGMEKGGLGDEEFWWERTEGRLLSWILRLSCLLFQWNAVFETFSIAD